MVTVFNHYSNQETYVNRARLKAIQTPAPTKSWQPFSHSRLLGMLNQSLDKGGFEIKEESHLIARKGQRYFGLLQVAHPDLITEDSVIVIGLRNAHDKVFGAGLCVGESVLVCSNLAFSGDIMFNRRHTRHVMKDLQEGIDAAVESIPHLWMDHQNRKVNYLKRIIQDVEAHDLIIQSFDAGILGPKSLNILLKNYREPESNAFEARNLWSLYNAYTNVLKNQNIFTLPARTQALHQLFDDYVNI